MLIKCPHDGATMVLEEDKHICPECDTELSLSEAEELFEAGKIVAIVEDDSSKVKKQDDDDDEDEDEESDEDEDESKAEKMKESVFVKLSDYDNVSKILRAGKKGKLSEEYMTDLVEALIEDDSTINVHMLDMASITEWAKSLANESAKMSEDLVKALAGDETLSEEVKTDVVTVFEAALNARAKQIKKSEAEKFAIKLAESEDEIRESVESEIDGYLDVVVNEWMTENKLAIESGAKVEMMESFMDGLHKLFTEHYVDIPEGKEDVLESLADQVTELQNTIKEMEQDEAAVMAKIVEMKQEAAFDKVSSDLAETSKEKLAVLAESVEFVEEEAYIAKLLKLKESFLSDSTNVVESSEVVKEGVLDESESIQTDSQFDYIADAVKALSTNNQ